MDQQRKSALLNFVSKVLHLSYLIGSQSQLANGIYLAKMCNKITGISITIPQSHLTANNTIKSEEEEENSMHQRNWKDSYALLSSVFEELKSYMKTTINFSIPNDFSRINLVEMAKGQDNESLMEFLNLIFLVGIQSQDKDFFVQKILMLQEEHQSQLMALVAKYINTSSNQDYEGDDNGEHKNKYQNRRHSDFNYEKLESELKQLRYTCECLSLQNESLKDAIIQESEEQKKIQDQLKKTIEERDKLKKEMLQNYNTKMHEQEKSSSNAICEHHEQMIEQLRKSLEEQENSYSQEIFGLKERIESVEDQRDMARSKANQLQERESLADREFANHAHCINRAQYKKEINEMNGKLTEISSKEWKTKLENIRVQNLTEELKNKNQKLKAEVESKDKENETWVSKESSDKLKLQFFQGVRDSLKTKLRMRVEEEKQKASGGKQGDMLGDLLEC